MLYEEFIKIIYFPIFPFQNLIKKICFLNSSFRCCGFHDFREKVENYINKDLPLFYWYGLRRVRAYE